VTGLPAELRARLAAEYSAVTPLASPLARAVWVVPFAALAFVAPPLYFNVRSDADQLGWMLGWGASGFQAGLGFVIIVAALRDSVPGRGWTAAALAAWIAAPVAVVMAVTFASWQLSLVPLRRDFWFIGAVCLTSSAATALPVVAIANVLSARAYPTRPSITGLLAGLGAGLLADGGWRMFCHFTEPSHVLAAHVGGVALAAAAGSILAVTLRTHAR
jgi:hypothetical protein